MAPDLKWKCLMSGGPRNGRVVETRPCRAIAFPVQAGPNAPMERHIYVLSHIPDGDAPASFVWDRVELADSRTAPVADPTAFVRHWQKFDRAARSRILTLRRLAEFIERKIDLRQAAGEVPHRARAEATALRWVLGRIGADEVVSRRATPVPPGVPGAIGRRIDDDDRKPDDGE